MERWRLFVLVFGPVLIVAASTAGALITAPKSEAGPPPFNEFVVPAAYSPAEPLPVDAALQTACKEQARRLWPWLERGDSLMVAPPFVIAGKQSERLLRSWHDRVVVPATSALAASYFDRTPNQPVTLILLDDDSNYRRYARRFAGEQELAYFGYYDSEQRIAVANVRAGGGTLLHELTHAMMEFDFPQAPAWFAEGLASLHEQCALRDDGRALVGLVNWRVAELKTDADAGRLRLVESLVRSRDFRDGDEGTNYAHARALVLYLQRRGVLTAFYKRFRDRFEEDPSGLKFLNELLEPTSDGTLDTSFRQWLAGLAAGAVATN